MAAKRKAREQLSRERVLRAALRLVDTRGLEALSMRKLAQDLGVEAMSLYNHVENKEDIVAGILDLVGEDVEPPAEGIDWKTALRQRAIAAHEAFARRPWAARIWMSSSRPSPERFAHGDAVLRCLREAGFSPGLTYRAFHLLEGYTLGYTLQQSDFPYSGKEVEQIAERFLRDFPADDYPYLAEHIEQHLEPHGEAGSFEFGLDLILDGLERLRDAG
ncbi:MAG TPA: TetR/AcrR family transcriptional regulator C-terminal domain-containing protein [Gaiellaceae bacterium]|nr:TetR/AcrR family transcriptional regulator C-terminal domain-containing protein [Gaiellaceae bacterium]